MSANGNGRLIRYPEGRALEDTAYGYGLVPTAIFSILLHVWSVEVEATVTESEPYDLIDRYLERGIAEAGLGTAEELADFFALDVVLVDRALRFLTAVGHVRQDGGRLALTDLGAASVRDGVRYSITLRDRRKLYFDGFGSRPLTRPYYDSRKVTLLTVDEAAAQAPKFWMVESRRTFRREALAELAIHPDRDRFNLPAKIDRPQPVSEEWAYLPMRVVRARAPGGGGTHHLAYTQVGDTADQDLSDLVARTPELVGVFDNDEWSRRSALDDAKANEWLGKRGVRGHRVTRLDDGTWRVTLPAASFGPDRPLPVNKVGSYVVIGSGFFHVWCDDEKTRRRALLERLDSYLGARTRADHVDAENLIQQVVRQLRLGRLDMPAIRQMAADGGRKGLAAQLGRLST